MSYTYRLMQSVEEIAPEEWYAVCDTAENPFMDLRFIRAVVNSMKDEGKFRFAVFYDEEGVPVGCACFSLYGVDGSLMAPGFVQKAVGFIQRFLPRFFVFQVLLCGLPVSTGRGQICFVPEADLDSLVSALDEVAKRLARKEGALFVSMKEFDREESRLLCGLSRLGYRFARSVVKYSLRADFDSFDDYYRSQSKRTRANMRKYFKNFEKAGLRYEHLKGSEGVERLYTDEVHRLYLAVFERAEMKFEKLPAEFFRELSRQLPEESRFTFLYEGERVVGFCCAVAGPASHEMLYCGVDYDLNSQANLYFNLMYRGLEFGLAEDVDYLHVGASADEFKRRLGCFSTPLYVYVKAPGKIASLILNAVFPLIFDEAPMEWDSPSSDKESSGEDVPQKERSTLNISQ